MCNSDPKLSSIGKLLDNLISNADANTFKLQIKSYLMRIFMADMICVCVCAGGGNKYQVENKQQYQVG